MELLHEGEKVILKDEAKTTFFVKGTLYLTSSRVVFLVMTGGLLSKVLEIKIDQPMSSIRKVSVPARKTCRSSSRAVWSRPHFPSAIPKNVMLLSGVH